MKTNFLPAAPQCFRRLMVLVAGAAVLIVSGCVAPYGYDGYPRYRARGYGYYGYPRYGYYDGFYSGSYGHGGLRGGFGGHHGLHGGGHFGGGRH